MTCALVEVSPGIQCRRSRGRAWRFQTLILVAAAVGTSSATHLPTDTVASPQSGRGRRLPDPTTWSLISATGDHLGNDWAALATGWDSDAP